MVIKDKASCATDAQKYQAFEWLREQSLNPLDHESAFYAAVMMYELVRLNEENPFTN